jgi:hypothetical protein
MSGEDPSKQPKESHSLFEEQPRERLGDRLEGVGNRGEERLDDQSEDLDWQQRNRKEYGKVG